MRYLGLDLGTKTCGVSISDKSNTIATPHSTIRFVENDYESLYESLKIIIKDNNITDIIIGDPINMDGSRGYATRRSDELVKYLKNLKINIYYVDERLTTKMAKNVFKETNKRYKKQKHLVDELSASIILAEYLNKVCNE